jgi:hypothetical protein
MATMNFLADPCSGNEKFKNADPQPLRRAMFRVLVEWENSGKRPGAECWQSDTRHKRPELVDAIRREWYREIGTDDLIFPWHDDFVMLGFVAIRKMSVTQKRDMCKYLEVQIPAAWSGDKERAE